MSGYDNHYPITVENPRWNGRFWCLKGDLSDEGLAATDDLDGVGAGEGRGQGDVTLYIYKGVEHDVPVLIEDVDGGAEGAGCCRQRVAVEVEDGHENGGTLVISIGGSGRNVR